MKTILYATDYSENSELALKYAYNMSTKMDAKLLVIHVFDYPTLLDSFSFKPEPAFPDIEGDAIKKHRSNLNAFCTRVLNSNVATSNIEIEAIMNKSVVKGIVEKANEINAFLLVVGMKGVSALREIIMGSTAKKLIEESPCPVLAIPNDSVNTEMKTIIYASDFEDKDLGAIDKLTKIAKLYNANIKIIHVSSLAETMGNRLIEELEEKFLKYINYPKLELDILYSDDPFNALKIYFGNTNADLMAMLQRESNGITSNLFSRNLVMQMESYGRIPLLSFNAKNYDIFHLEKNNNSK